MRGVVLITVAILFLGFSDWFSVTALIAGTLPWHRTAQPRRLISLPVSSMGMLATSTDQTTDNDENDVGLALSAAGDLLSRAACCLPNWYSSKEGLTGESPAVFGGAGTALSSAGQSWAVGDMQACVCDLFTAACTLDPIELGDSLEQAGTALEEKRYSAAALSFHETAAQLKDYGLALEAEEPSSSTDRESAGNFLLQASLQMQNVARLVGEKDMS